VALMKKPREGLIKAIVVDASPTARDLLVNLLQGSGEIVVIGTGKNGEEAVALACRLQPDVVAMEVSLPGMDGLEATRRIMREAPAPIVLIGGGGMHRDVDLTFKALQAGALTVVKKPGLADPETCEKLVQAVRLMADVPVVHHWGRKERTGTSSPVKTNPGPVSRDALSKRSIQLVGIASSTGGPGVLANILHSLRAGFPVPIIIVQHVTNGFATGLAEWLTTQTELEVSVASHGERPQPGAVLVAPDDYHVQLKSDGTIELYKGQPYRGLRPSANYLFRSMAKVYGQNAMGIILTGMGDDGVEGIETLKKAGSITIAQDEVSCVVYGMPREAVARKAVDLVLDPDQIAGMLGQITRPSSEGAINAGI